MEKASCAPEPENSQPNRTLGESYKILFSQKNLTKGFPEDFVFVEGGFGIELQARGAACKFPPAQPLAPDRKHQGRRPRLS